MNIKLCLTIAIAMAYFYGGGTLSAHDNKYVHTRLTDDAFERFLALRQSPEDPETLLGADWGIDLSKTYSWGGHSRNIGGWRNQMPDTDGNIGWLVQGAFDEDEGDHFVWMPWAPKRVLNHFYDPLSGGRLTDYVPPIPPWYNDNTDSFNWVTLGSGIGGPNWETWGKARYYAWQALVAGGEAERNENVAKTFYALGKVLHLLQDLSQPDHVRNDTHLIPWERWIENYGSYVMHNLDAPAQSALKQKLGAALPLDWRNSGYVRFRDFWDRDIYTSSSGPAPLDQEASGVITLGLAEFVNGNFLGEDATYYDESPLNKTFPYPRFSSTTHAVLTGNPTPVLLSKLKPMRNLAGDWIGSGLFLEKVKDGISVSYHSAIPYSAYMVSVDMPTEVLYLPKKSSVEDVNVLKEYHEVLLPKAISYSAGLLDYFFRGRIKVACTWDPIGQVYRLRITNLSGQSLKGGNFTLYSESSQKIRSEVNLAMAWSGTSKLADGEGIDATYHPVGISAGNFLLVYKGAIGVASDATYGTSGQPDAVLDPQDEGSALAAYRFEIAPRYTIALRGENATADAQGYNSFTLSWKRFLTISTNTVLRLEKSFLGTDSCPEPETIWDYRNGYGSWNEIIRQGSAHYAPSSQPNADPRYWVEFQTPVVEHPEATNWDDYQTGGDYFTAYAGDSEAPWVDPIFDGYYAWSGGPYGLYTVGMGSVFSHDCQSGTGMYMHGSYAVVGWSVDQTSTVLSFTAREPRYSYSDDLGDYCTDPMEESFSAAGDTRLSNPDTEANVRGRLAAASQAEAGAVAYGGKLSFADFASDSAYPNLKYHGFQSLHYPDSDIFNCGTRGQGDTGFENTGSQWGVALGYGLWMRGDPYFEGKFTTFEHLLAYSRQEKTNVMDFKGALSARVSELPAGASATISYELVTRKLFGQLSMLSICSPESGGTETSEVRTLALSEPVYVPMDHYGSTSFNDASWSSVPAQLIMPTEGSNGFLATAYCHRNKFRFYSKIGQRLSVTLRKTVLNYKDAWDSPSTPGGNPLIELVSAPLVTDITVALNSDFRGTFADLERGEEIGNHRQEIWYKPIAVTSLDTGATLDPSVVGVWRKLRKGNMGFPQLDHMEQTAWNKGMDGVHKNTQFYRKMTFDYDKIIFSEGTCLLTCTNNLPDADAGSLDFSTQVKFERLLDPDRDSSSWSDLKCFDLDWHCIHAESKQGSVTLDVPTVAYMPRPPVWGSLGYDSINATQASITRESHDNTMYLAYLSKSGVPTRQFYGLDQELQDGEGDLFANYDALKALENSGVIEDLYAYYEGFDCGCSNMWECDSTKGRPEYNPREYPFSIYTADPYFGINNVTQVQQVTRNLDQGAVGYYGVTNLNGDRVLENLRSTDLLSITAPAGHYVTMRNFKVTPVNP